MFPHIKPTNGASRTTGGLIHSNIASNLSRNRQQARSTISEHLHDHGRFNSLFSDATTLVQKQQALKAARQCNSQIKRSPFQLVVVNHLPVSGYSWQCLHLYNVNAPSQYQCLNSFFKEQQVTSRLRPLLSHPIASMNRDTQTHNPFSCKS